MTDLALEQRARLLVAKWKAEAEQTLAGDFGSAAQRFASADARTHLAHQLECAITAALQQAQQPDTVPAWPKFVQDECLQVLRNMDTELSATGRVSARIQRLINALEGMPAQQPGAQAALGFVSQEAAAQLYNDAKWLDVIKGEKADSTDIALYTHPQPPSIPEPSEEDVKASYRAYYGFEDESPPKCLLEQMRNALTTYTDRLRERIGGGV